MSTEKEDINASTRKNQQDAFIAALEDTCNISKACEITSLPRRSVYNWRKADHHFRERWDAAIEVGADVLEDEARRRAYDGVQEPVYHKGAIVGHVRKYSDTLLIFLLKGAKPRKYSDRMIHGGDSDNPVNVKIEREAVIDKVLGR